MPNSRSKYSEAAVRRRRNTIRDILLGVLVGLAVIFVIMAGRFIYEKSKDPNYRLAYLFGRTTEGTLPTLPTFPIESFTLPSSSDVTTEADGSSEDPTEDSTEGSTEETPEDTTEVPTEDTAEDTTEEPTTAETTEAETETTKESETTTEEHTEPSETSTEATTPEETPEETTPEETTPEETTPEETTPEETSALSDPSDINSHLAHFNMTEKELGDCRQLIVVHSSGTQCMLYFFDKEDKEWTLSNAVPSAPGVVGENGVTTDKKEGDGCTPAGYYAIGPCYGEEDASVTEMEYHQIVQGDYWVNDPDSEDYNTFVHIDDPDTIEWAGGEDLYDLIRYYRYMAVIRYNMDPIVPGAGSAVFLRCQADETATSGCVSTKDATVFAILRWLSPEADPHILIY